MTAAAFLPPPARPPHDPLRMVLGGPGGWPAGATADQVEIEPGGCALRLVAAPGAARRLDEASGSLGGLVAPANVALDCEGGIWLLGHTTGRLRRFDPCACAFATVPCTAGLGSANPRQLVTPAGIAAEDETLFVCDAGPPGRLLLFDRRSFALRAVWQPPAGTTAQPWSPRAVVVDGGTIYVADPANGGVHRFARWGGGLGFTSGLGAVAALALDCRRGLYLVVPGGGWVSVMGPAGEALGRFSDPREVAGWFPAAPFPVAADGTISLAAICASDGFDRDGEPARFPAPPDPAVMASGSWVSAALDSGIANCVWHRLTATIELADHQRVSFATTTAEVPLSDADVALLASSAWTDVPPANPGQDALILSPPGRYLWLHATLAGDGAGTPRLCGAMVEYPRISLRRYLPAAFGSDPQSADFTDRLLAIFDRGFRDIETQIDDGARLFDADSAPATREQDILGWIGSWLGLAVERAWPEAQRRAMVKAAAKHFACRGTVRGLRETLLLWLGWDRPRTIPARAACAPRCCPPARAPQMPQLVLEHWKLRRWLWLGKGRLGADAVLWGETILRRSQLGSTAKAGATTLDTTRNPLLDPFNQTANRFSVFLPAARIADPRRAAQLRRLIDDQRPADTLATLVPVHARMRISVQASIGFDAVVGCWPAGVTLDLAQLGRGTVLSGGNPGGPEGRIGRTARLNPARTAART